MRTRIGALCLRALLVALAVLTSAVRVEGRALAQGGAPSGWKSYLVNDVGFALPGDWQKLDLSQAKFTEYIRQIARSNPELAKVLQMLVDSGQLNNLAFLAVSTSNGNSANVASTPLPAAVDSQTLAPVLAQQLPKLLPGVSVIKSVGGQRVGGVDAVRLEFRLTLNLDSGTATMRGVQFYLLLPGKLHVFSVVGNDGAALPALADQIATTIQIGGAAPSPASATTRNVTNGGNLRREPRIAASNVLGQLCAGDTVAVLGEQGAGASRWLRVRVTAVSGRCVAARVAVGAEGWVSASLIGGAASSGAAGLTARVSAGGNVRRGPAVGQPIVGQIKAGDTVTLLGRNAAATWYRITTPGGVTGWANASLLSVDATTRPRVPVM